MRTADLADGDAGRWAPCSLPWRSFGAVPAFSGPVATVRCRDDNGLVRRVLEQPGRGRVLVIDGDGSLATALVGDVLAGRARQGGWAGIVVHGAVRDVVALREVGIGVLALGTNPRRGGRDGAGEQGVPVTFGGVTIAPGRTLCADEDGVLVEAGPVEDGER